MKSVQYASLPPPNGPEIMGARVKSALFVALCLLASGAVAQQQPEGKRDDLDVTMQIIVDPDAKLPDEVVRRIPLPARQPAASSEQNKKNKSDQANTATDGKDNAREAKELGREMADSAKQRAKEAAEQREQARRSVAEDHRRNPGRPDDPPRPPRPPPRN